jgi:hypothetical protein
MELPTQSVDNTRYNGEGLQKLVSLFAKKLFKLDVIPLLMMIRWRVWGQMEPGAATFHGMFYVWEMLPVARFCQYPPWSTWNEAFVWSSGTSDFSSTTNHQHSRNNFFDNLLQCGHSPNTLRQIRTPVDLTSLRPSHRRVSTTKTKLG